jgi:hypothetical protein
VIPAPIGICRGVSRREEKPTKDKCLIVRHGPAEEKVPEPEIGIYPGRRELIPGKWYPNDPRSPKPDGQDGFFYDEKSAVWYREEGVYDPLHHLEEGFAEDDYDPLTAIGEYAGVDYSEDDD